MKKRVFALLLCGLLLLGLTACGGDPTPPAPQGGTSASEQGGTPAPTGQAGGKEIHGIKLKEYTDGKLGYTLLCPDLAGGEQAYSDYWVFENQNDEDAIIFAFSEYRENALFFEEDLLGITDPHELAEQFIPIYEDVCGRKLALILLNVPDNLTWKDMSVSGLPSALFRGTVKSDLQGEIGITGICVVGEKRPYVFWAIDLSEDQSYLDMAQEVLEACVANFKEGS